MSVTCPQCGERNPDDVKICGMCGAVQQAPTTTQTIPPTPIPVRRPVMQPYPGIDAEYAGFWLRFVAAFIDWLILGFVFWITFGICWLLAGASFTAFMTTTKNYGNYFNVFILLFDWLYSALMESSSMQATLGKKALGIIVTNLDGTPISFGRATGRHFGKLISGLILYIGFIMAAFTEKKQALHDMMASCLVVKNR